MLLRNMYVLTVQPVYTADKIYCTHAIRFRVCGVTFVGLCHRCCHAEWQPRFSDPGML